MTNFDSDSGARPIAGLPEASGWTIALDGGTTNTRARLLHGTRLVATARRAVGVRDTVLSTIPARARPGAAAAAGPATARAWCGRCARSSRRSAAMGRQGRRRAGPGVVAAGMLSSEVGLVAVPHVLAPAGLDELARAAAFVNLPEVDDRPILVVPGVRTPAAEGPVRLVRFRRDARRGVRDPGATAALLADGRIAPGREAALPLARARTPSSSRSTPTAGSRGASRRSAARCSRRWRSTPCWRPACPRRCPTISTRTPRPPGRTPRDVTGWAARRSSCGSPRWTGTLDDRGSRLVLDRRGRRGGRDRPGRPSAPRAGPAGLRRRSRAAALALRVRTGRGAMPGRSSRSTIALAEAASAFGAATVAARRRILDGAAPG